MVDLGSGAGETWARIEGKIDLLNERNARNSDDIRDLRDRTNTHSNRLQELEAANHRRNGEELGHDKAVRVVYALASVCGLGGIAAAFKVIFPMIGAH